ncbi:MAG: response regulator [Rhodothermales bacterium]
MEVLLVEDDMITRRLLTKMVTAQGHTVSAFGDAEEAWQAFQEKTYPLLVLDWMLPGMSGLDLCRKVRASPAGPYCVVVVITAMTEPQHLEEVLEAGADDYLAKPVDRELLNVRLTIAERRVMNLLEHREAQEQLRLLDAAIRSSSEGILITTTSLEEKEPEVVYANDGMSVLTGYSTSELIGKSLDSFQGPKTNQEVMEKMTQSLKTGASFSTEVVHYKKDQSPYLVHWDIAPVRDKSGEITHYVSVQREITEQRRLERELVEISEREQQRIGRDLHDGLGQKLTGLAFMAKSLERRLKNHDTDAAEQAMTIAQLVNDAKSDARNLSKGLVTVDLKGNGIILAIEELAARVEQFAQVECRVVSRLTIPILDETVAMHIYRICQEALNNAIKHSDASIVVIELIQDDDQLIVSIEDNGKGLGDVENNGMGLRIMAFRAQMINAVLDIRDRTDGGTLVSFSLVNPSLLAQN